VSETKQPGLCCRRDLLAQLNVSISQGSVSNRAGDQVTEAVAEGLVREDGDWLYPVRDDIPIMLIDEAIPLSPAKS